MWISVEVSNPHFLVFSVRGNLTKSSGWKVVFVNLSFFSAELTSLLQLRPRYRYSTMRTWTTLKTLRTMRSSSSVRSMVASRRRCPGQNYGETQLESAKTIFAEWRNTLYIKDPHASMASPSRLWFYLSAFLTSVGAPIRP